jgi:hypothetical protein
MDAASLHQQLRREDGQACLEAALGYLALGLPVLPLCTPDHAGMALVSKKHSRECKSPGKSPWITWKEFQSRVPTEVEVRGWWSQLETSNVGVALGGVSGLIRIDTEGASAQEALDGLALGRLPRTWEFRSGRGDRTGYGRLYRTPGGVTIKTTAKGYGVKEEIRYQSTGAQTVLPPSRHKDGHIYAWIDGFSPADIEPAFLPDFLVEMLQDEEESPSRDRVRANWEELFEGVTEGGRNNAAAQVAGKILSFLIDPTDSEAIQTAWLSLRAWNLGNDPPLEEDELRKTFLSIQKREIEARKESSLGTLNRIAETNGKHEGAPSTNGQAPTVDPPCGIGDHMGDGLTIFDGAGEWFLRIEDSNPRRYWLQSPDWKSSEKLTASRGYILLNKRQLFSWALIRHEALDQAGVWVKKDSPRKPVWDSKRKNSLLPLLVERATNFPGDVDYDRVLAAALYIIERGRNAPLVEKDKMESVASYKIARLEDGSIIFQSRIVANCARHEAPGITWEDIREAGKRYGKRFRPGKDKKRLGKFIAFTEEAIEKIEEFSFFAEQEGSSHAGLS